MRRRIAALAATGLVALTALPLDPVWAGGAFVPGSVTGRAQSLRVGGFTGGLEYAITFGIALARAQGAQGNAQAQAIDFGVFGLIMSQPLECSGEPPIPPEQIPRPLRVNSVGGDHSATNSYADGEVVRGGTETVAATSRPSGTSTTEVGELELPGLVSFDGLHSRAEASITAREGRRDSLSSASVGLIELAGGMVRLEDVRWTSSRTSGSKEAHAGGFSVGRVVVAGAELPSAPAGLVESLAAANTALAAVGVALEAPVFKRHSDGTVEVTPLVVSFGGTGATNPVLGALFEQLQPTRDAIYESTREGGCPVDPAAVDAALTVFDIAIAGFSGSGGLRFEVGGTKTTHDTRAFLSPFGEPGPFALPPPPVVPSLSTPAIPGRLGSEPRVQAQPGDADRTSTRCETTHPSGSPGCSRGSAALAGLASLLVVAGLVGAETWRSRRRSAIA